MKRGWFLLIGAVLGAALALGAGYLLVVRPQLSALLAYRGRERAWEDERDSLLLYAESMDSGLAESRRIAERAAIEVTELSGRLRQAQAEAQQYGRDLQAARDQRDAIAAALYDVGEIIGGLGKAFGDAANLARQSQDAVRGALYGMVEIQVGERNGAQKTGK